MVELDDLKQILKTSDTSTEQWAVEPITARYPLDEVNILLKTTINPDEVTARGFSFPAY